MSPITRESGRPTVRSEGGPIPFRIGFDDLIFVAICSGRRHSGSAGLFPRARKQSYRIKSYNSPRRNYLPSARKITVVINKVWQHLNPSLALECAHFERFPCCMRWREPLGSTQLGPWITGRGLQRLRRQVARPEEHLFRPPSSDTLRVRGRRQQSPKNLDYRGCDELSQSRLQIAPYVTPAT